MYKQPYFDYDALATAYLENRQTHPDVVTAFVAFIVERRKEDLLEVGCGTGNYVGTLQGLTRIRSTGVDPSAEMLSRARGRFPEVAFQHGQAESLPFDDAQFDLIISVDVIHHVQDRPAYLTEAYRVLRPGGHICTVTDSESDIRRRRPLTSHFPETRSVELARYPAIDDLREALAESGFVDVVESEVAFHYELQDIQAYRDKSYSALHLIEPSAFARGIARLEQELRQGPIACCSLYTLLWAAKN
ncbi:MAG: class I SAM-dependent methyltransferase [Caldilineaceae bacterium]|nr:methyltransferase domain-containing protein [Caldilineaceae bacterium]